MNEAIMTKMKARGAHASALRKLAGQGQLSVSALVQGLRTEGYGDHQAVAALIALQREKKVMIEESEPYSSLASYAASPASLWFWAALAAITATLALVTVTSGAALYLRYAFGSALVLFIPGYALIENLYPKRELEGLTRLALSIGLSLALVPLTGLVLNYTPFGIRLAPVTVSIAGLSAVFLALALVRKHAYYKLAKSVT